MKVMKRMMALVIAMVMVLGTMTISAMAAENGQITINKGTAHIKDGHVYTAYQIFDGTLTTKTEGGKTTKTLADITWGAGVDGAALLTALKADAEFGSGDTNLFKNAATAEDVANIISANTFTAAQLKQFSIDAAAKVTSGTDSTDGAISGLDYGYYLVKDKNAAAIDAPDAVTAFILQVLGEETVNVKTDAPEINKKLKNAGEDDTAYRDANNVAIGDTVNYKITARIPDMTEYNKYYFIVNDTLSGGLTYLPNTLSVQIVTADGATVTKTLEKNTDYTVTTTPETLVAGTDTAIKIVFKNFIQYKAVGTPAVNYAGQNIVIKYDATLNAKAKVGVDGNPNEVDLVYSNNPNKEGTGDNEPGSDDDDVVGRTPKDTVITYSTNLKIKKVDESGNALKGVKFTISGYGENDKTTYSEEFVEVEGGAYWKLNDNTYTTIAPTTLTAGKYADQNKKYNLVVKKNNTATAVTYAAKEGTTDDNGIIDIGELLYKGSLPAGYYIIHEVSTLDGYNLLDHDITIKVTNTITGSDPATADINFENPATNTKITWTATGEGAQYNSTDDVWEIHVTNKSGSVLPSTGGMGTTLFYVIGGLLIVAAAIVIISKRRVQEG